MGRKPEMSLCLNILHEIGVEEVVFEVNGENDSGTVELSDITWAEGRAQKPASILDEIILSSTATPFCRNGFVRRSVLQTIRSWVCNELPGGWEINTGSEGRVRIRPAHPVEDIQIEVRDKEFIPAEYAGYEEDNDAWLEEDEEDDAAPPPNQRA